MAEASRRAARQPRKGGLSNALFVAAAAEALPPELDGRAHAIVTTLPVGLPAPRPASARAPSPVLAGLARRAQPGCRWPRRCSRSPSATSHQSAGASNAVAVLRWPTLASDPRSPRGRRRPRSLRRARPGPSRLGASALEPRPLGVSRRRIRLAVGSIPPMPGKVPFILDVDTGIDDALALLLCLCLAGDRPRRGDLRRRQRRRAPGRREHAGRPGADGSGRTCPSPLGRERPLVKPLETHAGDARAARARATRSCRRRRRGRWSRTTPPTASIAVARERPGEVVLVTLGPLTNLAVALEREPLLPRLLGGYVLMGGAFRAPATRHRPASGTCTSIRTPRSRSSRLGDAGAERGALPLAMGLDVTEQARFRPEQLRSLAAAPARCPSTPPRSRPSPCRRSARWPRTRSSGSSWMRCASTSNSTRVRRLLRRVHPRSVRRRGRARPIAGAQPADLRRRRDRAGPRPWNDRRRLPGPGRRPPNVDVAVEGDADRFLERFIERVGALAARMPIAAR